jgi:hypothetical protein
MTRTAADLNPRPGDVLLLLRDAGDPASLLPRLRKLIKALGRRHGITVVSVEDVKPQSAAFEIRDDDGETD